MHLIKDFSSTFYTILHYIERNYNILLRASTPTLRDGFNKCTESDLHREIVLYKCTESGSDRDSLLHYAILYILYFTLPTKLHYTILY